MDHLFSSPYFLVYFQFFFTFFNIMYLLDEPFSKTHLKMELVSQLEWTKKQFLANVATSIWSATGTLPYLSNVELQHFFIHFFVFLLNTMSMKFWDRKYRAHRIKWDQIQLDCLRNERIKKCRNHISRLLVIRLPLVLITRQVEKKIILLLFVEINYSLTYFPRLRLAQALA